MYTVKDVSTFVHQQMVLEHAQKCVEPDVWMVRCVVLMDVAIVVWIQKQVSQIVF